MKKKVLILCLVVAMAATAIIGGTLAYLTDTKEATNIFTVGNVEIELLESQLHRSNASGNGVLASPEDADKLIPADDYSREHGWDNPYYPDSAIEADAANYNAYLEKAGANNMIPGSSVRKMPYVKNVGTTDAFVRVRVLVPVSLFEIIDNGPSMWTTTAMQTKEVVSNAVNYYNTWSGKKAFMNGTAADYIVERGGIQYYEFDFTYTKALAPEEMTFWNCWGNIAIDPKATSEDLADVDSFNVIVEADAIQAQGFDGYAAAFEAFDAQNK